MAGGMTREGALPAAGSAATGAQAGAPTGAFVIAAGTLIIAGGIVAAVNSAAPFDHGSWLAAYLVLVGGVAQLLLAAGRLAVGADEPTSRLARTQLVLWNVGGLAVAAGVLVDAALAVSSGSVSLLVALTLFATGARRAKRRATARRVAYYAVILALAASVVVGSALADAPPGGWI